MQIRMNRAGVEKIDELADQAKATRSDVIRVALAIALADPDKIVATLERKRQQL